MNETIAEATAHYLDAHPEEATTLGVLGHDARWAERSPAALDARARQHAAHLEALAATGADQHRDGAMLMLHLDAERRRLVDGEPLRNVEHGPLTHAVLRFQALHATSERAWEDIAARAASIPRALGDQEALLRRGLELGRPADAVLARAVAEHECALAASDLEALGGWAEAQGRPRPRCAPALAEAGALAASSLRAHARFLVDTVASAGASTYAIGEAEYARRLRLELGVETSPSALAAHYEASLPALRETLLGDARACASARGDVIVSYADACALVGRLYGETLGDEDDPLAIYGDLVDRAARFAVDRGMVRLPEGYALGIEPMPAHRVGHVSSTNWPAPPLDPSRKGHLLVSPRPSDHARANLEGLAVHEATPGHYLQSVAFQARFAGAPTPPARLFAMTDELAMAQGVYGAMLAIEGWATRSTDVMNRLGFFSPEARVIEAASRIIHTLRVVVDIGLHAGAMDRAEAARRLAEETGFPLRWAEGQALRYSRIPLQAICYRIGADEIDALEREAREREGASFDFAAFHAAFLDAGPIPPAWHRTSASWAPGLTG